MRGDAFDSRDIIARIADLEADTIPYPDGTPGPHPDAEMAAELDILRGLASAAAGYVADWEYGEAFIPEHRFEDYARDLAEDIGAIPDDASWPVTYIDWPAAAAALQQDYTSFEVDGITYWAR
jgi:hypothetical protein